MVISELGLGIPRGSSAEEIAAAKQADLATVRATIQFYAPFAPGNFRQQLGLTDQALQQSALKDAMQQVIDETKQELGVDDPKALEDGSPEYQAFFNLVTKKLQERGFK